MKLAALVALGALLQPTAEDPCEGRTAEGATARLCMDPAHGLSFSAAGGFLSAQGAADLQAELRLSGQRQAEHKVGTWLQQHRIARVSAQLGPNVQALRATLYELHWRRHMAEPYVSLPTNPPVRLPFPFDIAFDGSVLGFERRSSDGPGWTLETTRGAVLLDVLRSRSNQFHLAFGPALHHVLRSDGVQVVHEFSPLTGGMVFLHLESDDGLWLLRLRGTLGAAFVVDTQGTAVARLNGRAELDGERVLVAINNQPLSLTLRAQARLGDAGPAMANEWSAALGLSLRFFGSR